MLLTAIIAVVIPRAQVTKECCSDLYSAGVAICIYNLFFVVRNIFICAFSYNTKNPVKTSLLSRLAFICIDCLAYTVIVIWATVQVTSENATRCKDQIQEVSEFWWMVLIVCVIGYLQMFIELLICLVTSCTLAIFCCIYFNSRREERERAVQRLQQHAPMLARALSSLRRNKFKDLSTRAKEAKSCIICFENFNESDDVTQLSCDERHVFHQRCLESWMNSDTSQNTLKCPICRNSVVNPV